MDSGNTLYASEVCAHRFIGFEERSLGEEMQLKVGEEGKEGIGIMPFRDLPCMSCDSETIGGGSERFLNNGFKQTGFMETSHGDGVARVFTEEQGHIGGVWQETPNHNRGGIVLGDWVGAKNCQGIPVVTLNELFELITRQI
jgi:hypothetical protein